MPGVEIDRSTLWKRARQDKHGNIPDPKVAEKAKLIDELQKQVSEGKVRVDGSKDVLTMALGPEHPGRLRGVGAGISPRQYFNLPKPQRVSFDDRLKESLRVLLQEETNKMEAKAKEEALRMEARTKQLVEAEREHFLSQLSQLIPNFDPGMLKQRISQSPKNPMSDKASCSGGEVKSLHYEDDNAKNGEHQQEEEKEEEKRDEEKEEEKEKKDEEKHDDEVIEVGDYSNMEAPSSLKSLCRYVETTLLPEDKLLQFTIDTEVFGGDRDTFLLHEDITQFAGMEEIGATVVAVYMRYLHDVLKQANMCSMVGFIDPATVSANSGTIAERSRLVAARLQKTDDEQIFMMPYNPGRRWILLIVRAKKETVYFLDPLPGHRVKKMEKDVPEGYSSNIKNLVSLQDSRLLGLKSHDCHTLMQQLLPVAIRSVLEKPARYAITRLCFFFNAICAKTVDVSKLDKLEEDVVVTLCLLEKYFPPSFFDIMVHLVVHLVREVRLCGPVYFRWMYPFERYMKVLKGYVQNRTRPEGCIAERYIAEEALEFCTQHLSDVSTVGVPSSQKMGVSKPLSGCTNTEEVLPYIEQHMIHIKTAYPKFRKRTKWLQDKHNSSFIQWLRFKVQSELEEDNHGVS
ncbi:hypothetical protein L3X38_004324 [Prunus dulcis]|uniref:DUF4218 domain-containing protein n=1 Tax=Prunus dulcis TaxID=3755 RepID=A0AAD4ZNR3_PRUDU|nr:hypothetical protein L3X38_004324 [Prunus dulcis]